MHAKFLALLKAQIGNNLETFSLFLDNGMQEKLKNTKDISFNINAFVRPSIFYFDTVHYSWFLEMFQSKSKEYIAFFIAHLPKRISYKIAKHFEIETPEAVKNPFLKKIMQKYCIEKSINFSILPKELLELNPLSKLLECTKDKLEYIFNLLGLYDLANELKEVVDKNAILTIQTSLNAQEKHFLNQMISQKSFWALPKQGLSKWMQSDIHHQLQKNGLVRVALALSGMQKDFIQHLCYKIDTGRASIIQKLVKEEAIVPATKICQNQILELFNLIEKETFEVL
ncbi:MAG: hypothetical protein K940chlam8_00231 [Chlamydiae bacterium]|nr:hypothetical protein [Chlamydiota bacterium]